MGRREREKTTAFLVAGEKETKRNQVKEREAGIRIGNEQHSKSQ